jgi:hypothetical protein
MVFGVEMSRSSGFPNIFFSGSLERMCMEGFWNWIFLENSRGFEQKRLWWALMSLVTRQRHTRDGNQTDWILVLAPPSKNVGRQGEVSPRSRLSAPISIHLHCQCGAEGFRKKIIGRPLIWDRTWKPNACLVPICCKFGLWFPDSPDSPDTNREKMRTAIKERLKWWHFNAFQRSSKEAWKFFQRFSQSDLGTLGFFACCLFHLPVRATLALRFVTMRASYQLLPAATSCYH